MAAVVNGPTYRIATLKVKVKASLEKMVPLIVFNQHVRHIAVIAYISLFEDTPLLFAIASISP